MGKRIVSQARGHGGPRYRTPSFRYLGKLQYRPYDDKEKSDFTQGEIRDIVDCQGHTAPLAVIQFGNEYSLVPAAEGMYVGQKVLSGATAPADKGNTLPFKNIPEGTPIFNIEGNPGDLGKYVRSAGGFARIDTKIGNKIIVKMPSKKSKEFSGECRATIGIIAGAGRVDKPILKAGKKYFMMKAKNKLYPKTSAGSMNATDHPFGSGRGGPTYGGRASSIAPKNAPPGRKVGMLRPRRTGGKRK